MLAVSVLFQFEYVRTMYDRNSLAHVANTAAVADVLTVIVQAMTDVYRHILSTKQTKAHTHTHSHNRRDKD